MDGGSEKRSFEGAVLGITFLKLSYLFIAKVMQVILLSLEYTGKYIDNGKIHL